jgi:cellulose synthase/poly-beta-1,6-N-acetylglucosamine synthase-like glycosyltransferase
VAVLIAAFNEEEHIAEKVVSVLEQSYPAERLRCIVVSDGSSDGTVKRVSDLDSSRCLVIDSVRAGKAMALNRGLEVIDEDIVVFSDANSMLSPTAIAELVAPFGDASVGGVAGDQRYGVDGGAQGERLYWNSDRLLKLWSSRGGSVTSATGALYAMRRSLVDKVPEGMTDDFAVSTMAVDKGFRLVFAPAAFASEVPSESLTGEYRRKVRVMTRGLQSALLRRRLLLPWRVGFYAVQFFTLKILRRLTVFPLITLFVSSLFLAGRHWVYAAVAVIGTLGIGLGVLGLVWRKAPGPLRPALAVSGYVIIVNVAALHAIANLITGRRVTVWQPERSSALQDNHAAD